MRVRSSRATPAPGLTRPQLRQGPRHHHRSTTPSGSCTLSAGGRPRGGKWQRVELGQVLRRSRADPQGFRRGRRNEVMYHVGGPATSAPGPRAQGLGIDGQNSHTNVCSPPPLGYALWSGYDRQPRPRASRYLLPPPPRVRALLTRTRSGSSRQAGGAKLAVWTRAFRTPRPWPTLAAHLSGARPRCCCDGARADRRACRPIRRA